MVEARCDSVVDVVKGSCGGVFGFEAVLCMSIFLSVLFEVCGTVLVNCLLKEFAICVDVTEGLLLKEIV